MKCKPNNTHIPYSGWSQLCNFHKCPDEVSGRMHPLAQLGSCVLEELGCLALNTHIVEAWPSHGLAPYPGGESCAYIVSPEHNMSLLTPNRCPKEMPTVFCSHSASGKQFFFLNKFYSLMINVFDLHKIN